MKSVMNIKEVSQLILEHKYLFLAGSYDALSQLPKGNWIGGTIPYFMTPDGGTISDDIIQVTQIPQESLSIKIKEYDENTLSQIPENYFENGFSLIVIPAFSKSHQLFAKNCTTWAKLFNQPLVGWITGSNLSIQNEKPQIINGQSGQFSQEKVLTMHVQLNQDHFAEAKIVNIFQQGNGDSLSFLESGFEVREVLVNNQKTNLADYLVSNKIDLQLPLVANYLGAMINVSFKEIDHSQKLVRFYAPVFPGVEYKIANSLTHYEEQFENAILQKKITNPTYSCNCILNFLYAKLEGKKMGPFSYAMTFGEIAYMLLNQTFVYLDIKRKP